MNRRLFFLDNYSNYLYRCRPYRSRIISISGKKSIKYQNLYLKWIKEYWKINEYWITRVQNKKLLASHSTIAKPNLLYLCYCLNANVRRITFFFFLPSRYAYTIFNNILMISLLSIRLYKAVDKRPILITRKLLAYNFNVE